MRQQQQSQQPMKKQPPVTSTLNVSLEDLYKGGTKRVRITKKIMDVSGRRTEVKVDKEIAIKAGWKDGTKITYEKEGDEAPGTIPADIQFVVSTKPHDVFERSGDDLIATKKITLAQAINGFSSSITHLDGRQISFSLPNATPDSIKIIPGDGMPSSKTKTKGDLKIKFYIIFPDLSQPDRVQIGRILMGY